MLKTFDMNLFLVFHVLMEERSVTRAGDRLGRTQSAISNALKRLRLRFDDPLFVRTPDGLAPTPRAEELHRDVERLIGFGETCLERASEFDPMTSTRVFRLGAPDRLGLPVFLPFLETMRRLAPGLEFDIRATDQDHALRLVESQEIDAALGTFASLPSVVNRRGLYEEKLVCLVRPGHPVTQPPQPVDLHRLLDFHHVVVRSGGARIAVFDANLERLGLERKLAAALGSFTLVPSLLRDSDLVGVFTMRTATYMAENYGLVTLPLPIEIEPIPHGLIWHRRMDADRGHAWVREQLLAHCAGPSIDPVEPPTGSPRARRLDPA
ncbi:LysR family transcriptional regulator [Albimonas pacifica]|uniref:Transcriptional regulator, LysR family n=1 Tax=Albimonas pacifica TaxID=1114924 RepID=A0A1I3FTD7_9RHOB|nr:LysR family transcriptional regulator [Albimonas pacifica]SFI14528.1 transcriptional regulator, LysR family [Albimonas pacifica]